MKNTFFYIIFLISFLFCSKNVKQKEFLISEDIPKTTKDVYCEDLDTTGTLKIEDWGNVNLVTLDQTELIRGYKNNGFTVDSYYYFILKSNIGTYFVKDFDSTFIVKIRPSDTHGYLAFVHNNSNGAFSIFDIVNSKYQEVFSSIDGTGFAFSIKGYENTFNPTEERRWIDAPNNRLLFKNIDINKDGYLDIYFSGEVKGSFLDSQEIFTKKIEMIYLYNSTQRGARWNRYISDTVRALPFDLYHRSNKI